MLARLGASMAAPSRQCWVCIPAVHELCCRGSAPWRGPPGLSPTPCPWAVGPVCLFACLFWGERVCYAQPMDFGFRKSGCLFPVSLPACSHFTSLTLTCKDSLFLFLHLICFILEKCTGRETGRKTPELSAQLWQMVAWGVEFGVDFGASGVRVCLHNH